MAYINVQIPAMDAEHLIDIEVRVNGNKTKHRYRIEIFYWDTCTDPRNHAQCLREKIQDYDRNWRMIQIGGPTRSSIPVMFKQISE